MVELDEVLRELMEQRRLMTEIARDVAKVAEAGLHHSKTNRLLIMLLGAVAIGSKVLDFLPGV